VESILDRFSRKKKYQNTNSEKTISLENIVKRIGYWEVLDILYNEGNKGMEYNTFLNTYKDEAKFLTKFFNATDFLKKTQVILFYEEEEEEKKYITLTEKGRRIYEVFKEASSFL
jgi:predicted transcriptional regulator